MVQQASQPRFQRVALLADSSALLVTILFVRSYIICLLIFPHPPNNICIDILILMMWIVELSRGSAREE